MMISQRMGGGSPLINVMVLAAEKAGKGLIRDFGEIEHLQVSRKSLNGFVSTANRRSETLLFQELTRTRPHFGILSEEKGDIPGEDKNNRWIIHSLDGVTNFLHAIPYFGLSIALESYGEIVSGLIFNPVTDELYWAEKGKGAFLNQRRLRVSGRHHLDEAVLSMGSQYERIGNAVLAEQIISSVAGVRRLGSPALDLAFVAAGKYEGCIERGLKPWHIAAGSILVKEAGGSISDFQGESYFMSKGDIIAGNDPIFLELKKKVCSDSMK